ncbi:fibroleukin-like [Anopheles darlingi]|uniref:fibroleukin-like n=1 Tax=Anopheles darlingi TaxID=43151 RepID=UPI002100594C|nr:fibroleukin-like [Anopheles darlingi]
MKLHIGLILFCAAICVGASDRDREEMKDLTKFDFIATKLHNMEVKLQNMEVKLQNIEENQRKVDNMELLLQKIEKQINDHRSTQEQSISNLQKEVLGALQNQDTQASRNYNALQNQIQQSVDRALHKIDQDVGRVLQKQDTQHIFSSCMDVPSNVSGTYTIRVKSDGVSVPFEVYCEQKAFGGGWIVIQHRFDGSLDFYRGWNEFRDGFGDFDKEFWLGLEKVHQLTKARNHELIVELKDFNASDRDREERKDVNHAAHGSLGYGLELLLTKFDVVTNKLQKIEDKLQRTEKKLQTIENQFSNYRSTQEQSISTLQSEMFTALQKLETQVVLQLSKLQNQNQEKVDAAFHKLDGGVGQMLQKQDLHNPYYSCKDLPSNASDKYVIRVNSGRKPFKVYCEQKAFGGGWIVIQYRYDGSLDFYRDWNEFRNGFGDFDKEFWLGLEKVHQITRNNKHELIIELKDFNGNHAYARYDGFEIGSESEGYVLKELGAYSGTAGDSMSHNNDEKFSTKDRDNDQSEYEQCAHEREGAWWHFQCTFANLNGRYMDADDPKSMYWDDFKERQGLSYSRMMIREME